MEPPVLKARPDSHTQVGLILVGRGNKETQRTLQLEECSMASTLMSLWRHGLCSKAAASNVWYVV